MYFSSSNTEDEVVVVTTAGRFTREELKPYEKLDFNIKTEICSVKGCENNARGIIRCMSVCTRCYKYIRLDNKKRILNGIDIPADIFDTI